MAHQGAIRNVHCECEDVEIGESSTYGCSCAKAAADGAWLSYRGDRRTDDGVRENGRHERVPGSGYSAFSAMRALTSFFTNVAGKGLSG